MPLLIADEEWARINEERLKEAHPLFPWSAIKAQNARALRLILGFSPYATNLLVRKRSLLELFLKEPFPRPHGTRALLREICSHLSEGDYRRFALFLREIKQREVIKILTLDLSGEAFPRTVFALSNLAEALLQGGLTWLLQNRFREIAPSSLLVLGMGKLGGRELNYSSDLDLVYFFTGPFHQKETYISLFRELTRLFDALLEGERLFRIDLRLRPGGKEGELAFSLKAGLDYYFYQSHPFERLALIKAKPCAGHISLGKNFLRALRPVIYPRFLDYASLEHIRDLKRRIHQEALKLGAARQIKIGPGGIREIEFFCQSLQMIYGGKYPSLRTRHTLWTLDRLRRLSLIPEKEARDLARAYIFLRTLEHRLQTVYFRQTAALPEEESALLRIARSMGYPATEPFMESLEAHRKCVQETFHQLLAPQRPRQTIETAEAFLNGEEPLSEVAEQLGVSANLLLDLKELTKEKGPLGRKRAPLMRNIVPEIFRYLPQIDSREQALAKLISFLERLGGRISFYYALAHHPSLLKDLLELFARSAFLTHLLFEAPGAAEGLFRSEEGLPKPRLRKSQSPEEALSILRAWRNEELFRLALADLKGKLSITELLEGLSRLAWEYLQLTYRLVCSTCATDSRALQTRLSVLGLGKLGSKELGYRSDLDMVFVALGDQKELLKATKIAQRLLHYLTVPLTEGPGYQVDTRLRPEGRKGPLVVSLEGFINYHQKDSSLWEKLALVRLAPIAGDGSLGKRVCRAVNAILANLKLDEEAVEEIHRMRKLMEEKRTRKDALNLKVGRGGLVDIEFITQWLMLKALKQGLPPCGNVLSALKALEKAGLLKPEASQTLKANYLFLRTLDQKLILLLDKPGEEKHYHPEELELCAPYVGKDVYKRYQEVTEQNRSYFLRLVR